MATASDTIQQGEWVVIQRENFVKVHKAAKGALAMLGRDCVELDNLLGNSRWSTYSLEEKGRKGVRKFTLKLCDTNTYEENVADSLVDEVVDGKDNRFIKDDGQSQKLSKEEIEEMQSEGASAKEIIGQLVENSSTFDQKTAYAKEKYVNKKQKKYKRTVRVRPTNVRLILQALAGPTKDYTKILGLREDSLSQVLYMSGAQSGAGPSTFLIFESGCQGIVSAATLERLGDDSEAHMIVIGPTCGTNKSLSMQAMNFPQSQLAKVHYVTLAGLLTKASEEGLIKNVKKVEIENKSMDVGGETKTKEVETEISNDEKSLKRPAEDVLEPPAKHFKDCSDINKIETDKPLDVQSSKPPTTEKTESTPRRFGSAEEAELRFTIERLKNCKADSLVVVSKENPGEVADALLPLVGNARPVVLFSQYREPLQETYIKLKTMKNVTALHLVEPWLRHYQVLNERTHPEVTMSGSGGYVLTGLTVDPN